MAQAQSQYESIHELESQKSNKSVGVLLSVLIITLVVLVGGFFIFHVAMTEREEALSQMRLEVSSRAETQAAIVKDWVDGQFTNLHAISKYPAIKDLMTFVLSPSLAPGQEARISQLNNLLELAISSAGYELQGENMSLAAILKSDREIVVRTSDEIKIYDQKIKQIVDGLSSGERGRIELFSMNNEKAGLIIAIPVVSAQMLEPGESTLKTRAGFLVVVSALSNDTISHLLATDGLAQHSGVITQLGDKELSILSLGENNFQKYPIENNNLIEALVATRPGAVLRGADHKGTEVLAGAQNVEGTNMLAIQKLDYAMANQHAKEASSDPLTMAFLVVIMVVIGFIGVRNINQKYKAEQAKREVREMAQRFEDQKNLLRQVTDNQTKPIFVVDTDWNIRFANRTAAFSIDLSADEMLNKPLSEVFGPNRAQRYMERGKEALEKQTTVIALDRITKSGGTHVLQTQHIPLTESTAMPQGVLIVEDDITAPVIEQERREEILRQLVDALVALVDKRDPYSSGHSKQVAKLASEIGHEMNLSSYLVETVRIAASLMNLGKILVPEDILTKDEQLTEEEYELIHNSMRASLEILETIEFDGPVVDTLRQTYAYLGGEDKPEEESDDEIIITSRILSVANTFVALMNKRAHREGYEVDEALSILMDQAGEQYDRSVITALMNYIDNHGGRAEWGGAPKEDHQHVSSSPPSAPQYDDQSTDDGDSDEA